MLEHQCGTASPPPPWASLRNTSPTWNMFNVRSFDGLNHALRDRAAMAFQHCGGHNNALNTCRSTFRSVVLSSPNQVPPASVRDVKHKNLMHPTTATVATSVRRCPRLPTSHATCAVQTVACSLDAQKHRVVRCACRSQHAAHKTPWCELACAYQSNAMSPAWQEYGA